MTPPGSPPCPPPPDPQLHAVFLGPAVRRTVSRGQSEWESEEVGVEREEEIKGAAGEQRRCRVSEKYKIHWTGNTAHANTHCTPYLSAAASPPTNIQIPRGHVAVLWTLLKVWQLIFIITHSSGSLINPLWHLNIARSLINLRAYASAISKAPPKHRFIFIFVYIFIVITKEARCLWISVWLTSLLNVKRLKQHHHSTHLAAVACSSSCGFSNLMSRLEIKKGGPQFINFCC